MYEVSLSKARLPSGMLNNQLLTVMDGRRRDEISFAGASALFSSRVHVICMLSFLVMLHRRKIRTNDVG